MLRAALPGDVAQLFDWRNRPEIVALSSSRKTVTLEEHRAWYARALADETSRLYIVCSEENAPIGQVRFDRHAPGEAVVSIYLVAEQTGRGEGTAALRAAVERARSELGLAKVWATIREDNAVSIKAFSRAGFVVATRAPAELSHPSHVVYLRESS